MLIVEIINCTFIGFHAQRGGALAVLEGGWAILRNSTFLDNEALYGGAVYVRGGKLTLDHCQLERNRASREGGALYIASGSVLLGNGTLLQANAAPHGAQLAHSSGELLYYLPAPLGPMMARKSSLSTSKSIPFSISGPLAVYLTLRFLTDKTDIIKFSGVPCR